MMRDPMEREGMWRRTKVSQPTASTKVPDMWSKVILDPPVAVKPLQLGTHMSPPLISGPQICEQKKSLLFYVTRFVDDLL